MRKKLIIAVCILAALAAGYYFAVMYEPPRDGENNITQKAPVIISELSSSDVTGISVINGTGAYTFVKTDGKWSLGGTDAELVDSSVNSLCYAASYISAADIIEESASDLSVYGLDNPLAVITVSTDGDSRGFTMGALAPAERYYYFSDGNSVYTISKSSGDVFLKSLNEYRNLTVVNANVDDFRGVAVTGTDENLSVKYSPLPEGTDNTYGSLSVWEMSSPVVCKVVNEKFGEKIITPACSITAEGVAEDHPSDLSKYNLSKTVKLTLENETISYRVGTASGVNYVYPEGGKAIYVVSADKLAFLDVKAFDIIEKFLAFEMLDDVTNVEINLPPTEGTLEVRRDGESETYYLDNDVFIAEEAFKSMFQVIIGLDADGFLTRGFDNSQTLGTVTLHLTNGNTRVLTFYPYDDINAAAEVDGSARFFIKKTKLTDLAGYLDALRANPTERVKPR